MFFLTRSITTRLGAITALGIAMGCTGSSSSDEPAAVAQVGVDKALVGQAWPMLVVEESVREPYQQTAFVQLVLNRDYKQAVADSKGKAGLTTARFHADSAAMFRQAALATANAYVQYFDPPLGQQYDPPEKAHLLLVGKIARGDLDGAKTHIAAVQALPDDSAVQPWAAPWLSWLQAGADWPPDLSALPGDLPPVEPGGWPEVTDRPSYTLREGEPGKNELRVDDPGLLIALALWHERAAAKAAPEHASALAAYGARYRLPVELKVTASDDLPLELLFGSDYLTAQDAAFMAAVFGAEGTAAIDSFADRSLTAAVARACQGESGKIDNVKAVDLVNDLRRALKEEQGLAAGQAEGHHPIFADVAVAGLYRNLAYIAELEGDRETSGKLRIAARDVERDAAAAPEGLLSLAAWDADNQYTIRGSEIIHQLARRAPSLEVARTAFDLIGIRVSRSRGGGTPGM